MDKSRSSVAVIAVLVVVALSAPAGALLAPSTLQGDNIVSTVDGGFDTINVTSGNAVVETTVRNTTQARASAVIDDRVLVPESTSLSPEVELYNASSGAFVQKANLSGTVSDVSSVTTGPTEDYYWAVSDSGTVVQLHESNLSVADSFTTNVSSVDPNAFIVTDDSVIIGVFSDIGVYYQNGTERWLGSNQGVSISGVSGLAVGPNLNHFYSVGLNTEEVRRWDIDGASVEWSYDVGAQTGSSLSVTSVGVGDGTVIAGDNNGQLYTFHESNGSSYWNGSQPDAETTSSVYSSGYLWVAGSGGTLTRFGVDGSGKTTTSVASSKLQSLTRASYRNVSSVDGGGGSSGVDADEQLRIETREYMKHNTTTPFNVYAYNNSTDTYTNVTGDPGLNVTVEKPDVVTVDLSSASITSTSNTSVNDVTNVTAEYDGLNDTQTVVVANETIENLDILPPMQKFTATIQDDNSVVILIATGVGAAAAAFAGATAGVGAFPLVIIAAWVSGFVGTHVLIAALLMSIMVGLNVAQQVQIRGR